MGLFKSIGNFFKTGVGKAVAAFGSILAAPFTAGASLAAIPFLFKGKKNTGEPLTILSQIEQPIESKKVDIPPPPPIDEPTIEREKELIVTTVDEQIEERVIGPVTKIDVTLYGFYSDVNKITIPVDNDLDNIIVVPSTTFPFIVEFQNHPPSEGVRYVSEFIYQKLLGEWQTNLGKVLHTLEDGLSIYPYIRFDWQTFVEKYNTFNAGNLERDGGILYGFTISPVFLLQWIDGPEPSNLLEYSWKIPPKVKTVDDLNPVDEPQPNKVPANATTDPKRIDKLRKIIDSVTKVGTTFAIAKAALGGIKSIYGNTKDSIKNLSDTATKLGNKFADLKANLSKDAINGKISDVKNLIKAKLPTPKNLRKKFIDVNGEFLTGISKFQEERLKRKTQRREAKDKKLKVKFTLKNFSLPPLPEIPTLPSIPTLPKKLTLANLNQLPGFGKLPNISGLVAQGKGIVSGVGNINLKDPMSLLNAPTNILNQVNGLGNSVAQSVSDISKNLESETYNKQKELNQQINQLQQQAKKDLQAFVEKNRFPPTTPTTALKNRIGTTEFDNTTTFGSGG